MHVPRFEKKMSDFAMENYILTTSVSIPVSYYNLMTGMRGGYITGQNYKITATKRSDVTVGRDDLQPAVTGNNQYQV